MHSKIVKVKNVSIPTIGYAETMINKPQNTVFVGINNFGKINPVSPINIAIEQVIHNIGVRSGIGRPLFPHLIRHTTATNAIDHGMDVTDLQKLLGHTRISTTMIYAKVTQENVRYSHHRYVV